MSQQQDQRLVEEVTTTQTVTHQIKPIIEPEQPIVSSTSTGGEIQKQILELKEEENRSQFPLKQQPLLSNEEFQKEHVGELPHQATILERAKETTTEAVHVASEKISNVAETAKEVASTASDKIVHVYSDTLQPAAAVVGEKISDVAHVVAEKVSDVAHTLTSDDVKSTAKEVAIEAKDILVTAAVITKDSIVEGAHVASDVASKVYHWVADTVVSQKDNAQQVVDTASNVISGASNVISSATTTIANKAEDAKEAIKETFIGAKQATEEKILSKDFNEPSPLINMDTFPLGMALNKPIGKESSEHWQFLKKNEIIPQVFASPFEDIYQLEFEFGQHTFSGYRDILLAPGQVAQIPNIYLKHQPRKISIPSNTHFLALAMIDPDFPSRGALDAHQFVHWLVVNIPAKNLSSNFRIPVEQGQELVTFMPSMPGKGTGKHRYLFFLFEYDFKMNFDEFSRMLSRDMKQRADFDFK